MVIWESSVEDEKPFANEVYIKNNKLQFTEKVGVKK